MGASGKKVGNGLRAVPNSNGNSVEKPKYDDWLPSALGQLAADIAGAWDNKPTPYKRRRIALLLDELLSLIEGDADLQQIFTRLPLALDKGLILQSFYSRVFPPPPELPTESAQTDVRLTKREREVLQALADGIIDNQMIAKALRIKKPSTVTAHRRNIYNKLQVHDESAAIAKGAQLGLVKFDAVLFVNNIVRHDPTVRRHGPLFDAFLLNRYMKPDAHNEVDHRMRLLHLLSIVLMITSYLSLSVSSPSLTDSAGAVCELNAEGEVIRCFDGEGALHYPGAIAVAPSSATQQGFAGGNLFVIDHSTNPDLFNVDRIVELTPDGKFVRAFTGGSTLGSRLISCQCLTFGADGSLFASSGSFTDAILRFTAGGTQVERFGVPLSPVGLAVAPNGDVYVLSVSGTRGNAISVFDRNGDTKHRWRFPGTAAWAGVDPRGCVLDTDGNLFIGDIGKHRILKISPTGKCLSSFTCKRLDCPSYLALTSDGKLYVADRKDIKLYTRNGKLLKTIAIDPICHPHGVTVAEDGRRWVCGLTGK